MPVHREPWDIHFGARTLQRGTTYARQDRVSITAVEQNGRALEIDAIVEGGEDYLTRVRLIDPARDVDGSWICADLSAQCSCPVRNGCKHAAAVILTAEREILPESGQRLDLLSDLLGEQAAEPPPPSLPDGFPSWQLISPSAMPVAPDVGGWLERCAVGDGSVGDRRLIWILGCHEQHAVLNPAWQQRGKRGWLAPKPLRGQPQLTTAELTRVQAIDRQLLAAAGNHPGWPQLAEAIATERVYLQTDDRWLRVQRGPLRSLRLAWQADGAFQRLVPQVDGADPLILADTPCWIDADLAICGGFDHPPSALVGILPAPPVDHEQAIAATAQLRQRGLQVDEPATPPPDQLPAAIGEAAVFTVEVIEEQWVYGREPARHQLDLLLPCFRYDDQRLPIEAGPMLPDGRPRDRSREELLRAAMTHAGLQPVMACYGHLSLPHMPQMNQMWSPVGPAMFDKRRRQPLQTRIEDRSLRLLALAGWQISGRPVDLERVETRAIQLELREGDDGAVLGLAGEADDQEIDLVPLLALALRDGIDALPPCEHDGRPHVAWADPQHPSRLLLIDRALLERLVEQLIALHAHPPAEGEEWRIDLDAAAALAGAGLDARLDGERLQRLHQALSAATQPRPREPAPGFTMTLRDYQKLGLDWLERLADLAFGGVLADDMGLGKTIQCLAHIWNRHQAGQLSDGCLVVAPVSTLGNWLREAATCTPTLRCQLWHGAKRGDLPAPGAADLILTSYATLQRSQQHFADRRFSLIVCDEAQQLRNPLAKTTRALKKLPSDRRLALTGTPLENSHEDLWSLISWIEPGWLGSLAAFRKRVQSDAESGALRRRLAPILLRRTKEAVAADLPPRTEIVERIDLDSDQAALYETVRAASDSRIGALLAERGLAKSRIHIFEALLRLRQVCCDPRLLPDTDPTNSGAKTQQLIAMLAELQAEGRQALVFSSFASLLELLAADLSQAGIGHELLTGKTRNRQERIDRFQGGEFCAFLISLKAGGTGLNLTAADTVIHLDPWWNPMAERQATDRAHRIGQDKPVFVYKLVAAGTIEDRILELQRHKARMLDDLFDDQGQSLGQLDEATLRDLLSPM